MEHKIHSCFGKAGSGITNYAKKSMKEKKLQKLKKIKVFNVAMDDESILGDSVPYKNVTKLKDFIDEHETYYRRKDYTFRCQFHHTLCHNDDVKEFCTFLLVKFKNVVICKY